MLKNLRDLAFGRNWRGSLRRGFPNLNYRPSVHFFLGYELNTHSPALIGRKQLPELLQSQVPPVNSNKQLTVQVDPDQAT